MRRVVPCTGQHVMNQPAMKAAVPIFEGMDVYEPERQNSRRYDGIDGRLFCPPTILDRPPHQIGQVVRTCTDMFRNRITRPPVAIADPPALGPEPEFDESRVTDHEFLQAHQLIDRKVSLASLADRLAPTKPSIRRWVLAFDLKRRLAVFEEQKRRGAADDIRICTTNELS